MRHHAIVVTGSDYSDAIIKAHDKAKSLGCSVSELVQSPINGYRSFFVAPDGSKEGWEESERGDEARQRLKAFLDTTRHEDGSGPLDWIEVQFGDDNQETCIINDSDAKRRQS